MAIELAERLGGDPIDVGERQRAAQSQGEQPGAQQTVTVEACGTHASPVVGDQYFDGHPVGLGQQHADGDDDREQDALQHAEDEHVDEGDDAEDAVTHPHTLDAAQLGGSDQAPRRHDHERPQRGLGEIVEDAREQRHHERRDGRGDDRRQRAAGAGIGVHGGLRQPAAGREGAEEAAADVGGAERDELTVGVDRRVVGMAQRPAGGERLDERQQRDTHRSRHEQPPRVGDLGDRETARHRADHGHTAVGEIEPHDQRDADDHGNERPGPTGGEPPQQDEQHDRAGAQQRRQALDVVEAADDVDALVDERFAIDGMPSTSPSWPTMISSPVPALKPARIGAETRLARNPARSSPATRRMTPAKMANSAAASAEPPATTIAVPVRIDNVEVVLTLSTRDVPMKA